MMISYNNYEIADFDFSLILEIEGNVVENRHDLTIGGLTMKRGRMSYVLDFNQSYTTYNEDSDTTEIECTFPKTHFDVLEDGTRYNEEFPDCKFDLTVDSMFDADFILWVDGELDAEIKDMTLHAELRNDKGVLLTSLNTTVVEWSDYEETEEDSTEYIEYQGKQYKTRTLTMIEPEVGQITRKIAGEDLYDAISKNGEDDTYMDDMDSEEYEIDCQIYHYIEVEDLDKSGEYICKNCLDLEFEFLYE